MAAPAPPFPSIVLEILSLSQAFEQYRKFKQAEKLRQAHGAQCSEESGQPSCKDAKVRFRFGEDQPFAL
jgi:hypothetical protein